MRDDLLHQGLRAQAKLFVLKIVSLHASEVKGLYGGTWILGIIVSAD